MSTKATTHHMHNRLWTNIMLLVPRLPRDCSGYTVALVAFSIAARSRAREECQIAMSRSEPTLSCNPYTVLGAYTVPDLSYWATLVNYDTGLPYFTVTVACQLGFPFRFGRYGHIQRDARCASACALTLRVSGGARSSRRARPGR